MASIEERFQAAVNVIKGLPKNGPYQPSTTMMLQFYGLFKQATEGTCNQKRPGFWDVVGRAKWDAWNSNRHLTKQQAMEKYVQGLREIIETMSFTENVQNFVGSLSGLENINLDELDMIAPGMRELAESHPSSPFNSRTNSPQHGSSTNITNASELQEANTSNGHLKNNANSEKIMTNGVDFSSPSSSSLDEQRPSSMSILNSISSGTVDQSDDEYGDPVDLNSDFTEVIVNNSELLKQVKGTVTRMNSEIIAVNQRIMSLEKSINDLRNSVKYASTKQLGRIGRRYPAWWPFDDISPLWFGLLVLWPFLTQRLNNMLRSSRQK